MFPLPKIADELETNTRVYWGLSSIRNNRSKDSMTVEEAFATIATLEAKLGPHRSLRHRTARLADAIVIGKQRKEKTKEKGITGISAPNVTSLRQERRQS